MSEKIYKSMNICGKGSIAIGIVVLVVGVAAGVLAIISGVKLVRDKSNILF